VHHKLFSKSLQLLSTTLQRDIYHLSHPGIAIEDVTSPSPDPLAPARYSCLYRVDHLFNAYASNVSILVCADLQDGVTIHRFLREKYLYWLEALSLVRDMPKGVLAVEKLHTLIQVRRPGHLFYSTFPKIGLGHSGRISIEPSGPRHASIYSVVQMGYRECSSAGLCLCTDFQSDSKLDTTIISERKTEVVCR
jgi:hypothetical protein